MRRPSILVAQWSVVAFAYDTKAFVITREYDRCTSFRALDRQAKCDMTNDVAKIFLCHVTCHYRVIWNLSQGKRKEGEGGEVGKGGSDWPLCLLTILLCALS